MRRREFNAGAFALLGGATLAGGSVLTGCSSLPKASDAEAAALADAPRLTGRFGLIVPAGAGAGAQSRGQNVTANFELLGDPRRGQLEMSTPMGSLVARVSWQPGSAWVKTPDGDRAYDDMDALTQELLGETLPLQALFDWLRGRPWPQAPSQAVGEQGFQQLGWQVDLRHFADQLITARRLNPNGSEALATLRLKLDAPAAP